MESFAKEPCIKRIVALVNSSTPPFSAQQIANAFIGNLSPKKDTKSKPKEDESTIDLSPFDEELSYLIDKSTNYVLKMKEDGYILVGKYDENTSKLIKIPKKDRDSYCEDLPYEYDNNYFIQKS